MPSEKCWWQKPRIIRYKPERHKVRGSKTSTKRKTNLQGAMDAHKTPMSGWETYQHIHPSKKSPQHSQRKHTKFFENFIRLNTNRKRETIPKRQENKRRKRTWSPTTPHFLGVLLDIICKKQKTKKNQGKRWHQPESCGLRSELHKSKTRSAVECSMITRNIPEGKRIPMQTLTLKPDDADIWPMMFQPNPNPNPKH